MFITANQIISQCKVKIFRKKFPCIHLGLWKFSWLLSCLLCDIHLSVRHHYCSFAHPPSPDEVRIPRRTATRAHFVAINKGARQLYEHLSRKFELVDRSTSEQFFLVKFQINFTAEFRTNSSYGLLLQRFLWSFSGIFIISVKADTRKFQSKLSAIFFLLDAIFFKQ